MPIAALNVNQVFSFKHRTREYKIGTISDIHHAFALGKIEKKKLSFYKPQNSLKIVIVLRSIQRVQKKKTHLDCEKPLKSDI